MNQTGGGHESSYSMYGTPYQGDGGLSQPPSLPLPPEPPILLRVTAHDVLSGRGINISQHAGNERFRALVQARHDAEYCHSYTTSEKRAVAEQIIAHIRALDPPGRFLKRPARTRATRGLDGPWEQLSEQETIKKACQALRDCNRQDRSGYASSVLVPTDVQQYEQERLESGMSNKEQAERAATRAKEQELAEVLSKRAREESFAQDSFNPTPIGVTPSAGGVPTNEGYAGEWLKKQKLNADGTPIPVGTPATAASTVGMSLHDSHSFLDDDDYSPVASAVFLSSNRSVSPTAMDGTSSAANHFQEETLFQDEEDDEDERKPAASPMESFRHQLANSDLVDPLQLAAEAAAAIDDGHHSLQDFGGPSPLHSIHNNDDDDDDDDGDLGRHDQGHHPF